MSVDEKNPSDYVTLDDPVCSVEDGCGGSGYIGQGICDKCQGTGRRKRVAARTVSEESGEGIGRRRRLE